MNKAAVALPKGLLQRPGVAESVDGIFSLEDVLVGWESMDTQERISILRNMRGKHRVLTAEIGSDTLKGLDALASVAGLAHVFVLEPNADRSFREVGGVVCREYAVKYRLRHTGAQKPISVYLAGPLFTMAERQHNLDLAKALSVALPTYEFILPQARAAQFYPDLQAIAEDCLAQVRKSDFLVASFDGPDADSGTCVELGYAMALGIPVVGYRTDFRGSEVDGVNLMLRHGVVEFVKTNSATCSLDDLAAGIAAALQNQSIGRLMAE